MNVRSQASGLLVLSVAGFAAASASILLMPIQNMKILPGLLFWVGMITGVTGQILLHLRLRKRNGRSSKGRCGLLSLCTNRWGKMADIGLAVSFLAAVLALAISPTSYICYPALALTMFCFCMHCILNGRNFGRVLRHDRSRQVPDHEKLKEEGDGMR